MLINEIEKTIIENSLIERDKKYGVAVSGGMDSMFLLNALLCLKEKLSFSIVVLHYEHGIRGSSSVSDMEFVKDYCAEHNVTVYVEQGEVLKVSKENRANVEDTARRLRYDFFNRTLESEGLSGIFVAHHKNDSVETVLLNLIRGAGLNGLRRMKFRDGNILRPLLNISREQIEKYVEEHNIPYVYDQTNSDLNYSRNYVRKVIIPDLKKINDGALDNIYKASCLINDEQEYLYELNKDRYRSCIKSINKEKIEILLDKYNNLNTFEQRDFIRYAIYSFTGSLKDISFDIIEYIRNLSDKKATGKRISLPQGLQACISYDLLIISSEMYKIRRTGEKTAQCNYRLSFEPVKNIDLSSISKDSLIQYIDGDRLPSEYEIRTRQNGDYFRPLGMSGKKKLKDWFIDNKLSRDERENQLLLCSGSEVLWIIGRALGNTLKIDERTTNYMKITLEDY